MRLERFGEFMTSLLRDQQDPAITDIQRFVDTGYDKVTARVGLAGWEITFITGAQVFLNFVGGSPPGGDDRDEPEPIVEAAEALPPVPVPAISTSGGRIRLEDVRAWLAAVVNNSGSREIVKVLHGDGHSAISIYFERGNKWYGMWTHTLRPGQKADPRSEYKPQEVF